MIMKISAAMRSILIIPQYQTAIHFGEKKDTLLLYDLDANNEVIEESRGILLSVNPDIAQSIEDHFGIDVKTYGIEVKEERISFS